MKTKKLTAGSDYMPLPIIGPSGFGYWHPTYLWYYTRGGIYVRTGWGQDGDWYPQSKRRQP
ncbi:MAG: hypothetical protein MN733_05445, partial [Nitrososphaera sp.]|nr:hypothetical protein [Nitrososphaera sp.]